MDPQVQDNGGHVRQGQVGSDQRSGVRQLVQLHQSVKNSVREYRPRPERIHRARGADPGLPADGLQVHPRQLHRGLRQHQAADGHLPVAGPRDARPGRHAVRGLHRPGAGGAQVDNLQFYPTYSYNALNSLPMPRFSFFGDQTSYDITIQCDL